ncbi:MAG: shikimate kinase [Clostridiales bacterium]|nr:shikimate kinase [Clostridiales bacterium]
MRNVVLIGMPGCGKSTVGVLAAKALAMDFVDTDLLLQRQRGKPLQRMVDELGTAGFSEAEERCVRALEATHTVIATGGSVALEDGAMAHLRKDALIVFLYLPYETVEKRLKNIKTRGIAMGKGQTLRDLYDLRQPAYRKWADVVLEADGLGVEKTVSRLVEIVRENGIL